MEIKLLKKLLEKENITQKEIWNFFAVENQKDMEDLIVSNLNNIKNNPDDGMVYIGPDMIYETSMSNEHNIFYEKMMVISYFLKSFSSYDNTFIEAFITSVGMVRFVFIAERTLNDNEYFVFFKNAYQEYKKDRYFREQTARVISIFDTITNEIEKLDIKEIKELTQQIKDNT
jgi:hypothetical protein